MGGVKRRVSPIPMNAGKRPNPKKVVQFEYFKFPLTANRNLFIRNLSYHYNFPQFGYEFEAINNYDERFGRSLIPTKLQGYYVYFNTFILNTTYAKERQSVQKRQKD